MARRNQCMNPKNVDKDSYASALRQCRDVSQGKRIHFGITENGHDHDTFVANHILQMYGKCHQINLARQVFDELRKRNVISWTLMITAYTQNGHLQDALQLLKQMKSQRVKPDDFTFSSLLSACIGPKDLAAGVEIHSQIFEGGLESNVIVATGLVGMYARCGDLDVARQVFDRMTTKDAVSWTTLIVAYAQQRQPTKALEIYKQMDVEPTLSTYGSLLDSCSQLGSLNEGKAVHMRLARSGLKPSIAVQNALLDMYSKCGNLDDAMDSFEKIEQKNVVTWGMIIGGCSRHGCDSDALKLYRRMDSEGVQPDVFVFATVLGVCSNLGDLTEGKAVHTRLYVNGFDTDIVASSALVKMYAKCGSLDDARRVFDRMPCNKDIVCWTAMLGAYTQHGQPAQALLLYKDMMSTNLKPDIFAFTSILAACASLGDSEEGRKIHLQIIESNIQSDVLQSAIFNMYFKCGGLSAARKAFDQLQQKDPVAITGMLTLYAREGHFEDAMDLYYHMNSVGIQPDKFCLATVFSVCSYSGALAEGRSIHRRLILEKLDGDHVVQNALVDMYGKCGSLGEAQQVFEGMDMKDAISWTSLISAYARLGYPDDALELLWETNVDGVELDGITFTILLQACSHGGLLDLGHYCFISMMIDHFVDPQLEHYVGMVDLLARMGKLNEAEDLIVCMPFQPSVVACTAFVSACRTHCDINRASCVKEEMQWMNSASLVLLSNIFTESEAGS